MEVYILNILTQSFKRQFQGRGWEFLLKVCSIVGINFVLVTIWTISVLEVPWLEILMLVIVTIFTGFAIACTIVFVRKVGQREHPIQTSSVRKKRYIKKKEIKGKFDTVLIASQILRALVKSMPVVGPGLEEISFGTYEKIESKEARLLLNFIVEHLGEEIKSLSEIALSEEDLKSRIDNLLRSQYETREIILREIKKSIDTTDKSVSDSIEDYLLDIAKDKKTTVPLGFDIFAIPITLNPGELKIDGILPFAKIPQRKILIHGKPACGKTTAVKRIFITANDNPELIPIELSAGDVGDISEVEKRTRRKLSLSYEKTFTVLENAGRFFYIFDGLNEYREIENLARDIYMLSNSFLHSKFLVTCRSHEYKSKAKAKLEGFYPFEIKDLSWTDQKKFFEGKVTNEAKRNILLTAFRENFLLQEVCSNQFIFLMAAELIPERKILPRISSEFYNLFLHRFLLTWEKSLEVEKKKKYLEEIAYRMSYSEVSKVRIDQEQVIDIIRDVGVTDAEAVLEELLHNGLLERKHGSVRFFQQTFQEFLLASYLVRKGIFPKELSRNQDGYLEYRGLEIRDVSECFYLELTGIKTI